MDRERQTKPKDNGKGYLWHNRLSNGTNHSIYCKSNPYYLHRVVYHPYCCFDFLNAKTAVWFSQKEQNQIAFFVWCKEAKAKYVDILFSNTPLILHIIVKINVLGSFCMLKMTDSQCFFVLLQLTFVRLSRHIHLNERAFS